MPGFRRLGRRPGPAVAAAVIAVAALGIGPSPSTARAQAEPPRPGPAPQPAPGSGARPSAEDPDPPRVSVLRLQVVRPEPQPPDARPGFPRLNRFGFPSAPREGTSITLLLEEPGRSIRGVQVADCRITRFRDDKGTDLAPDGRDPAPEPGRRMPHFGEDQGPISAEVDPAGHQATITLHSPRLPAGGADRLTLEAVLAVTYARGEKTIEQKDVDLHLDRIKAGPSSLVVMTQEDANRGGMPGSTTQVILFHQGPMTDIKKVAFLGPDGQEIPAHVSGSGQSGSIYQASYTLSRKVETCSIRLTAAESIETRNMAVTVETGLGFPPFVRRRALPASGRPPAAATSAPR